MSRDHGAAGALFLAAALGLVPDPSPGEPRPPDPEGLLAAGKRLYREGRLTSGEAASAIVQGDVPMAGTQIPCMSCHGRSGMGISESGRRTPPVAGPLLFHPDPRQRRPAYTDETLATALRHGVDARGRPFDPLMPRYPLGDRDIAALAAHLRGLGATPSPGVDEENLRFATVIADDVDPTIQKAVLDVLNAFMAAKNAEVRHERARTLSRRAPREERELYRVWSLDVWRLSGPSESWREQLEALYREKPVFALLSGVAAGPWRPIHEFCEGHEIPCLLPNTNRPPEVKDDVYSYYYSGGLRLEAQIVALEIRAGGREADVLQLVRRGDGAAADAADALEASLRSVGGRSRIEPIQPGAAGEAAAARAIGSDVSAVVLWLGPEAVRRIPIAGPRGEESGRDAPKPPLFVSSILLDGTWEAVPKALRPRTRVVHLFRPPADHDSARERFRSWAKVRGLEVRAERLQAQTYFACIAVLDAASHLGRYPYRDYLLDILDHASGLATFLPIYPRGDLGPGQRYLGKGGYVIETSGVGEPRWVVP